MEQPHVLQGQQKQRFILRKTLRLLPTLLVWLSLSGAVIRESKGNSKTTIRKFLASAADPIVVASEHRSGRTAQSSATVQLDEGFVVSEDGAIEVLDDLQKHFQRHKYDDKYPHRRQTIDPGVIVIVAVDGTMAGISKENGQILWKHSEATAPYSSHNSLKGNNHPYNLNDNDNVVDASQFLQPLVSTTTTTKSASTASYAVVPSIDGTVFTTSNDMTVSTSVKELVARSPFLDPRGRFYVGSRQTAAVALDVETGEILRVVYSGSGSKPVDNDSVDFPPLHDRNVLWIGRVDHSVSVQDARTGIMDAQFSVAEVMSVADMHGMARKEAWTPERLKGSHSDQSSGLPVLDDETAFDASILSAARLPSTSQREGETAATLVATPNGNVALYDVQGKQVSWVTNESFDSPVAYAMDSGTGLPVGVDIIPDVIDPNGDNEYVRREIQRHLTEIVGDKDVPEDQTIVGAMPNGQLYALPLGKKAKWIAHSGSTTSASISSTSSAAAIASISATNKRHTSQVSQLPGRPNANFHDPRHQQNRAHEPDDSLQTQAHFQTSGKSGLVTGKKPCTTSSPTFPACLVPHNSRTKHSSEIMPPVGTGSHKYALPHNSDSEGAVSLMTSNYHKEVGGFYHPDFGYVSPDDLYRFQQRSQSKSYKKILWLLTSWLPPTILCIFVASFELGRRKRMRDEKQQLQLELTNLSQVEVKHGTDATAPSQDMLLVEQKHVISVSEEVLGYGGHGTVVYKGVLDGRNVAVKRMLKAYHASADREISLLIESDGDPNVVRYFLKEVRGDFVYLALELCDLSLHDLISVLREHQQRKLASCMEENSQETRSCDPDIVASTKRILFQIASGVKHLHSLRIVHRDLKPANILCAVSKRGKKNKKTENAIFDTFLHNFYDAKISDMGLGKQLLGQSSIGASLVGESSFRGSKGIGTTSIGVGPGSVGWQAPEVMAMRLTSDISIQSNDSTTNPLEMKQNLVDDSHANPRTSRSVDIFSLGCIFYSLLIPGSHPYGEWFEREANIIHNRPNLEPLKNISIEAYDLVRSMLDRSPRLRPTAKEVCQHPFFWSLQKKLMFLCDFSDRLETENPQQMQLSFNALAIERGAVGVVGTSWESKLDGALIDNVQKFRSYDYSCVRDLLRLIRNKHHHFEELPEEFRTKTVPDQDALCEYFETRFPTMLMHCYQFCRTTLEDDDVLLSKYEIRPLLKFEKTSKVPSTKHISSITQDDISSSDMCKDVSNEDNSVVKASSGASDLNIVNTTPHDDLPNGQTRSIVSTSDENGGTAEPNLLSFPECADIIVWEGSVAAKAFNCRGWSRSDDEWSRHIEPIYKKRDPVLKRCMEDSKFRTRLCNHWDESLGTFCTMRKKNKCIFAHGPAELRVKDGKKNRWGRLVDKNGNNSNPWHSGGEDTYGPASTIEEVRKEEGKWNANNIKKGTGGPKRSGNKRSTHQKNGQVINPPRE
ncbi:phospholipid-translocating P-type ATPase, flippase [Nitzschia inconspicua]|uniref:non-specific serine/threonine protein kinase n=1 Tax=Nitzschia inconspicua TaxID=303405 RepID=A0A9K3LR00_9STRA|nr:phospholipid-translocating P-type ATPase, flippase [Nitzschia inconspicua]